MCGLVSHEINPYWDRTEARLLCQRCGPVLIRPSCRSLPLRDLAISGQPRQPRWEATWLLHKPFDFELPQTEYHISNTPSILAIVTAIIHRYLLIIGRLK